MSHQRILDTRLVDVAFLGDVDGVALRGRVDGVGRHVHGGAAVLGEVVAGGGAASNQDHLRRRRVEHRGVEWSGACWSSLTGEWFGACWRYLEQFGAF
jgi:hypothetical protein